MSIRVVCRNGHALNVKDSMAGQGGLCPKCKAPVKVPEPRREELSEDAIMSILGPQEPASFEQVSPQSGLEGAEAMPPGEDDGSSPPKKSCRKCNQEISAGTHICPHCHTFIAELTDI